MPLVGMGRDVSSVCEGYVFTGVCGGVPGRGACMAALGACMAGGVCGRGHAWQGAVHGRGHVWWGGMHGMGHALHGGMYGGGMCMVGGCEWWWWACMAGGHACHTCPHTMRYGR